MVKGVDPWHDVSTENKAIIENFVEDLTLADDRSKITIKNYKDNLIRKARWLGKNNLKQVLEDEQLMKKFLFYMQEESGWGNGTINTMKIAMRVFYQWLSNEENPQCLRLVKCMTKKKAKRTEDPVKNKNKELKDEEYEIMLNASLEHYENVQMPAMLEVLRYFGCRPKELKSMNIGGAGKDKLGVFITITDSKTHTRKIYVKDYNFPYFLKYLDGHPNRRKLEAPVWISYYGRAKHLARLDCPNILARIKEVAKLAGINRAINPYSFRHRCMNYRILEFGMEPQQASFFFGTSINTIMDNYIHNRQENYIKYLQNKNKESGEIKPSYNELEQEKQQLKTEFEERFMQMEEKMAQKMAIFDQSMKSFPGMQQASKNVNIEQLLEQYHKMKNGLTKVYEKLMAVGRIEEAHGLKELIDKAYN